LDTGTAQGVSSKDIHGEEQKKSESNIELMGMLRLSMSIIPQRYAHIVSLKLSFTRPVALLMEQKRSCD
jgi:hypothetical protein